MSEKKPITAWTVVRVAPGLRDDGAKIGPFFKEEEADEWVDENHKKVLLKEVEFSEVHHPSVPEEEWIKWVDGTDSEFYMLVTKCCGKNPSVPPWGLDKAYFDEKWKYHRIKSKWVCPGCGNPIKRNYHENETI